MDGGEPALAAAGRCTLATETPVRFACAPMSYGRRNHDAIRALFAALALAEASGLPREELPTSVGLLADESPGGCMPEGSLRPRLGTPIGISVHMSKHACHFGSSACSCINAANLARNPLELDHVPGRTLVEAHGVDTTITCCLSLDDCQTTPEANRPKALRTSHGTHR